MKMWNINRYQPSLHVEMMKHQNDGSGLSFLYHDGSINSLMLRFNFLRPSAQDPPEISAGQGFLSEMGKDVSVSSATMRKKETISSSGCKRMQPIHLVEHVSNSNLKAFSSP